MEPNWVSEQSARYIHAELMAEHGGLYGPSREGALEAALARPQNLHHYSKVPASLERLAAAYGFGIARGHCFPDGNKRLSLAVMDVFLQLNGRELTADEANAVIVIRGVAAGEIDEEQLTDWIAKNSGPLPE
jgi:death-on-curing protein